jgi:hypothetical protein
MKRIFFLSMMVLLLGACKKSFDAEPTYAKATIAGLWAKNEPFYQPNAERFDESTNSWRRFNAFSVTSEGEPDKLGFINPYVAGKGVNALDMTRIYSGQNLTSDSGYYNITIPKCFQFVPNSATDITQGKVIVLEQDIKVYRRDKSFFTIRIAPGTTPGTYNTVTGAFEVEISFDETSLGGVSSVKRKYRFSS